jgi:hypothetical protein
MEHSSRIGRWTVRFDPDLTAKLYLQTSPSACDCIDCVNFRAAGDQAFSPPFLFLLRQLGVDRSKPAELCHCGTSGQEMPTHGWFHFVGQLDDGADAWQHSGANTWHLDPEPFPGIKSIGLTSRINQAPEPFEGHPLLQLEFETNVPWVEPVPFD